MSSGFLVWRIILSLITYSLVIFLSTLLLFLSRSVAVSSIGLTSNSSMSNSRLAGHMPHWTEPYAGEGSSCSLAVWWLTQQAGGSVQVLVPVLSQSLSTWSFNSTSEIALSSSQGKFIISCPKWRKHQPCNSAFRGALTFAPPGTNMFSSCFLRARLAPTGARTHPPLLPLPRSQQCCASLSGSGLQRWSPVRELNYAFLHLQFFKVLFINAICL